MVDVSPGRLDVAVEDVGDGEVVLVPGRGRDVGLLLAGGQPGGRGQVVLGGRRQETFTGI